MYFLMPYTLITAASENHFKSLCQFLDSVQIHSLFTEVYVYDLGLSEQSIFHLCNYTIIYKKFNYSNYPSFFDIRIENGQYAWKPVLLWEVAQEVKTGVLLWCDAGNILTHNSKEIYNIILMQGIFSPISSGDVRFWTHPGMQDYFCIENSPILDLPPRNGAILGFNLDHPDIMTFMKEYSILAHKKECIAPEGSSRENHRQDQSLFTILYYQYTNNNLLDRELYMSIHNDID